MRKDYKLVHFNSSSYNGEIAQLQSTLNDDYNNFSGKIKHIPHFKANNWKIFPKLVLVRSLRWSFIDSVSFAKNASFSFSHVIGSTVVPFYLFSLSLFFFLFLDFIIISDCVFNKTIILLGLAGYQMIITNSALRVSFRLSII